MSKHFSKSKLPDIKLIRSTAIHLMNLNHVVTSPEVKSFLQNKGFNIKYSEINYWMICLATREGWEYTLQAGVREYRLKAFPGYDLCCEALGFSSN